MSSHRKITDFEKIQLLENCLDTINKRELQFLNKAAGGRQIAFSEFWAKLLHRYGEDINECARRKMRELELNKDQQIEIQEWRDFKVKFLDIWHDLPSTGADEAYQMLIEKMPPFIINWIVDEQEKRKFRAPKATISPFSDMTRTEILDSIEELIEIRPKDAWVKERDTLVLQFETERPIQILLGLKGKRIQGSN